MLAVIATGVEKFTCCQPDAVSPLKVAVASFVPALLHCLTAHEFWFTFIWLLPLGLPRLSRMDRRWVWATAATFLLALLFGAYNNALGNTTRAFFNISGPLLSLSAAAFLTNSKSQTA